MNKKAFTLVELIVVVTILAILSTIGFISYQGYSISTRDGNRAVSLQGMQKILELAKVQEGEYPEPTGGINVTYTGSTVWTQGTFGDEISINVDGVDKKSFVDPLTKLSYVYSRLNTNLEYEIAGIYEGDKIISKINLSNNTYAAGTEVSKAVVIGNYNKQVASVKKGTRTFILAVPTIISGDITLTRIEDLIAQDKLVYDGFKNLPSNYRDSEKFNPDGEVGLNLINDTNLVVFSGSITSLQDENNQITFVENLQKAYEYTDIEGEEEQEIILSYNPVTNEEGTKYLAQTIINDYVSKKVKVTAKNETSKDVEYFGSNSQFTKHWNNNTCENRNMNIVEVNPGTDVLAQTLDPNTIYIFNSGDYIFSHSLNMDDCSALIGKGTTTLYSNTSLTSVGMINSSSDNGIIIKNLNINGTDDGSGGTHFRNGDGIRVQNTDNITITDINTYKSDVGLYVQSSNYADISDIESDNNTTGLFVGLVNNNTIKDIKTSNNSSIGVHISGIDNSNISNIETNLNHYGIRIHGISNNDSTIENVNTNNNSYIGFSAEKLNNFTIKNITSNNNSSVGIYIYQSENINLSNSVVNNNGLDGILVSSSTDFILDTINSYSNTRYGIYMSSLTGVRLSNSNSYSNSNKGLAIANTNNLNINSTFAYNNIFEGLFLHNTISSTIENSEFHSNTTVGVQIQYSDGITINSNKSYNNNLDGALVSNSDNINIIGLNSFSNKRNGVALQHGSYNKIQNSVIHSNDLIGLSIQIANNNSVSDLNIYNNLDHGIKIHTANNNDLNNIKVFNNVHNGLLIESSEYNSVNNTSIYNNLNGLYIINSNYNVGNNLIAYKNEINGINSIDSTNNIFNNISAYGNDSGFNSNNSSGSKYYGSFKSYNNSTTNNIGGLNIGSNSDLIATNLGFSDGVLDETSIFSIQDVIIPSVTGWDYLIKEFQSSLTFLSNEIYTYGTNIPKQKQPIKWDGTSFILYGINGNEYNISNYISNY